MCVCVSVGAGGHILFHYDRETEGGVCVGAGGGGGGHILFYYDRETEGGVCVCL